MMRTIAGMLAAALCVAGARAGAQEAPAPVPAFTIAPRAYVQFDWRGYPEWDVVPGSGRLNHDTVEVRRVRLGVEGQLRRVSFEVTLDPQDAEGVLVKDAYAQARFSRALRVRAGQFKLPGSREYGRSARTMDFMERAALADSVSAGRDIGGSIDGEVGRRLAYDAGVFAGDGNGRVARAGVTGAGRVEFAATSELEIGGSFSLGRTEAADADDPNSLIGRSPAGYRFFEQVYVNGWRLRTGGDARWERGAWRVDGEFLRAAEQRREQGLDFEDLPDVAAVGWSAAVTRRLFRRDGRDRVRWREIEVGGRVDALRFDDVGPATEFDSVRARATDIRPRSVLTATLGVSWQPNAWIRVMTNASWERYGERRSSPRSGDAVFPALGTRLQVSLP
jgi:phosphate-selective porin